MADGRQRPRTRSRRVISAVGTVLSLRRWCIIDGIKCISLGRAEAVAAAGDRKNDGALELVSTCQAHVPLFVTQQLADVVELVCQRYHSASRHCVNRGANDCIVYRTTPHAQEICFRACCSLTIEWSR